MSAQKPTLIFCQIRKYVKYLPSVFAEVKNSTTIMIKLMQLTIVQVST